MTIANAEDAKGGVYFTASVAAGPLGNAYYLTADRQHVTEVANRIAFTNGEPCRRTARRCLSEETPDNRILRFAIGVVTGGRS